MSSEYLAQVKEIIGANISSVINNTNLIEKSMAIDFSIRFVLLITDEIFAPIISLT